MLGVVFFIALLVTLFMWGLAIRKDARRIHLWKLHLAEVSLIGSLATATHVNWWLFVIGYAPFAFAACIDAFINVNDRGREFLQRIGKNIGLTAVGFWVPVEAFVHQPHQPWTILTYVIPVIAFTYVPFLSKWTKDANATIRRLATEDVETREDRRRRQEWLARR